MSKNKQSKDLANDSATNDSNATSEQLPDFDARTISKLSETLKEKIHHQTSVKNKGKQTEKPKDSSARAKGNSQRGKKRDNARRVVEHQEHAKQQHNSRQWSGESSLRHEIELLGGTEDDYDMVNTIESGSEFEGPDLKKSRNSKYANIHGTSFDKELSNILEEFSSTQQHELHREASEGTEQGSGYNINNYEFRYESKTSARNENDVARYPTTQAWGVSKMILAPNPDWVSTIIASPAVSAQNWRTPSVAVLQDLHDYAKNLLEKENAAFQLVQQSSSWSSGKFYAQVMTSGTLIDKISALTLAVQESPIHSMKALESLLGLARKRSRAQAIEVLRALKDLFAQGKLLPGDRKLHLFAQQTSLLIALQNVRSWTQPDPLPQGLTIQALIVWAYEDWLKGIYFEILKILETWCSDELEFAKARAISYVYELLKEKPEQESNLLRILTNKLGDPVKKIASRTSYLLLQLQLTHPAMKETIIDAIDSELLLRPNQSLHACYYAVITLNQTVLSNREENVSKKLLAIFFRLFVMMLNPVVTDSHPERPRNKDRKGARKGRSKPSSKKAPGEAQEEELREKIISAILTGVNRAYPYVGADLSTLTDHMDTLFKITHSSNFNTSIQAMMLIQQLSSAHQVASDRFYRSLYESLLDPRLASSSKQALYMNLLYKSLKADLDIKRVKAFTKRILQILTLQQPSFICGAMYLLHELEVTFPNLVLMLDEPEDHDNSEEVFQDVDATTSLNPETAHQTKSSKYDSHKRDPRHTHAENSCLWDLIPFLIHYHPSVSLGAEHLLAHKALPGKPDLNLHTLSHFLDRFVYRNPKVSQVASSRGSSMMQPLAGSESSALLVGGKAQRQDLPINTEDLRGKKKEGDIRPEDAFFHQYFNSIGKNKAKEKQQRQQEKKKKKAQQRGADGEDNEEDEIWDAMMHSRPDLEGDLDSGDDEALQMSDLDSDFSGSESGSGPDIEDEDEDEDGAALEEIDIDNDDNDEDEDDGPAATGKDEAVVERKGSKQQRKRLKSLPTFAAAEEYADMVEDEEGEDG